MPPFTLLLCGLALTWGEFKAGAGAEAPPPERGAAYRVRCTVIAVGRDRAESECDRLVAVTPAGQPVCFSLSDLEMAVPTQDGQGTEQVPWGLAIRVRVSGADGGRVRVDTLLEDNRLEGEDGSGVLVRGTWVRSVRTVRLGQTVTVVMRDDRGRPHTKVKVRVQRAAAVRSGGPSAGGPGSRP